MSYVLFFRSQVGLSNDIYKSFLTTIVENEELLCFGVNTKFAPGFIYTVFYFKENKKMLSSFMFQIDKIYTASFPRNEYDSWIVFEEQSFSLVEWKDNFPMEKISSSHQFTKERLEFAESLTENDNPVLMFMKFKPF